MTGDLTRTNSYWIVDTDAGVDDAAALLAFLPHIDADRCTITTVSGNVGVEKVNRNVLLTLERLGLDLPVIAGCARPLTGQPEDSSDIMGGDGLGGASEFYGAPVHSLAPGYAALRIPELVRLAGGRGQVSLLALGPLTNLGLALAVDRSFPAQVSKLVIMGGAVYARGNTSPEAEFNIYFDPEAASAVFSAGFPEIWLLPWEVSLQHPILWKDFDRLAGLGTPLSDFFARATSSLKALLKDQLGLPGMIFPDLLAAAVALDPSTALRSELVHVDIGTGSGIGRGFARVDWNNRSRNPANTRIVTEVDAQRVAALLENALSAG
jgi:purine nucleosidase